MPPVLETDDDVAEEWCLLSMGTVARWFVVDGRRVYERPVLRLAFFELGRSREIISEL